MESMETEFIPEKRIAEAVHLLQETEDSVEEIYMQLGYRNKKRFYQIVKEQIGTTLGEYRSKIKNMPTM